MITITTFAIFVHTLSIQFIVYGVESYATYKIQELLKVKCSRYVSKTRSVKRHRTLLLRVLQNFLTTCASRKGNVRIKSMYRSFCICLLRLSSIHTSYICNYTHLPLSKMAGIFKCIFMNEKFCVFIQNSLKFVPKGPIDNKSMMVQVIAWRRTGDNPLSEPMLTQFTDANMRH